jgi:hypothetical protein
MKLVKNALVAAVLASASLTAFAGPITDIVNPSPDITVSTTSFAAYLHDITDNGYDPILQTITSALLTIHLTDDGGSEDFTFDIGSLGTSQQFTGKNVSGGSGDSFPITLVASLPDLIADGKLNISVTSQSGSFQFADSTLTAQVVNRTPAALPEPGTLALASLAIASLGFTRRKRM